MGKLVRRASIAGVAIACATINPSYAEVPASKRERLSVADGSQATHLSYRGIVLAPERVAFRSDVRAPIKTIGVREGTTFSRGETLVAFDCRRERAEFLALEATARAAHARASQQRHLHELGAAGGSDVRVAASEAEAASANAKAIEAKLEGCRIRAPFDGRVAEVSARAFTTPEPGEPLMIVIGNASLEIEFVVSASALRSVSVGTPFRFYVDETDDVIAGVIERVGAEIDAASRTVKLFGTLADAPKRTLPGMTGMAAFEARR